MNTVHALMSAPGTIRLGWTLLHFLWQGTAIAFLYATIRFLFARSLSASARYALACAALLAMGVAPLLTFFAISGGLSGSVRIDSLVPVSTLVRTEWKWLPPIAVGLWVTGVFWFSVRLFVAVQFTRRLRKSAHPAPEMWQQTLRQVAALMNQPMTVAGRQVRLMSSSMVSAPAVIGYLRPVVLVPVAFFTGLPAEHIMALLHHEMAHICRKDYLACILQSFVEVALFYHPAIWWISGQVRNERELCCDDLVIAAGTDRLTYARALTEMESARPQQLTPLPAANGGSLMDRIRRLIEPSYMGGHYLPGAGATWAMILLLLVSAGVVPVHGAQTTTPSHGAPPAGVSLRAHSASRTPELPSSPLDPLLGGARKTLLYDPVFSAQLVQPPPAHGQLSAGHSTNPDPLVVEQVTVKTAGDAIVDGLRAGDFTLTEGGNQQRISFFEFENLEKPADTARPPVAAIAALSRLPHSEIAAEPAGQTRYKDHRLLALYFDMMSLPVPDQLRALDAAQKFIGAQMSQADMLCLIRHTAARVEALQDFTGDRTRLLSVIATMAIGVSDAPDTTPTEKLTALGATVKKLAELSEKKSLVYFSGGLNLGAMDNHALLRATINDAIRAGVSIWPAGPLTGSDEALNSLGADTGGRTAADSGDLSAAILSAAKSITSYYILGYSPTSKAPDGNYHRIGIALNNNTDAKLDYRQGYIVRRDFGAANTCTADDRERQLQEVLWMQEPVTDFNVSAEVNYFRLNNAESFVPVTVKIARGELISAKNNALDRTDLDLLAEIRDSQGTITARVRDLLEIRPDSPVTWNPGVVLLPGAYSIKIVARDGGTGRIGTFLGKFTIRNLNKETQVPISSVVLSTQFADDAPSTYRALPPVLAPSPLILNGRSIIPSVTRVFSAKDDMYVYLQAFEKGAKTAAPLMARVTFYKGSVKILETLPVTVSEGLDPKSSMLPIRMNVGLGSLTPGEYDCEITVLDPATQKSALWQKPVTIVP